MPLKMTPFEAVMLWDDRPAFPMVFWVEVDVGGTLDRSALEQAVEIVLQRHPLLRAGVDEIAGFPHWTANAGRAYAFGPLVRFPSPTDVQYDPVGPLWNSSFCLTVVPLTNAESDYRLRFQFHHTAADGIGACIVIGEILSTYDRLLRGETSDNHLADIIPHRLTERLALTPLRKRPAPPPPAVVANDAPPPPPPPRKTWDQRWNEMIEAWKFATTFTAVLPGKRSFRRPATVADGHQAGHDCPLVAVTLSASETDEIRRLGTDVGGLNDILLAWLYRAMRDWTSEHGSYFSRGTYRVTVPTNLRPAGERALPCANCISYAFLDRTYSAANDPAALLPGLAFATKAIVKYELSRQFLTFLADSCRFPRWFRWNIRRGSRMSSTVLSYVGDPSRRFTSRLRREGGKVFAGDLTMNRFVGAPPVRPNTRLAMAVTTYQDQLGIAATFDRQAIGRDAAEEFLQAYTQLMLQAARQLPAP